MKTICLRQSRKGRKDRRCAVRSAGLGRLLDERRWSELDDGERCYAVGHTLGGMADLTTLELGDQLTLEASDEHFNFC